MTYGEFRTGYRYKDVWEMLWSPDPDPRTWRYKRRHTVLGKWHEIKLEMWDNHLWICEQQAEYEAALDDEVPF